MNEDNNNNTNTEQNDLPVIAEEPSAVETLTDVVPDAPNTDELPSVTTENEQA